MEIDHEIYAMIVPSHPVIQEGQLSVFGKKNVHEYWSTA